MAALPPSGRIVHYRRFIDPDQFQSAVRGGDSLYTLLSGGAFQAELITIELGDLTLQNGRETLPRLAASAMAPGKVGIIVWFDNDKLPIVRGAQVRRGELFYLAPGMQSYHRSFGRSQFAALTVSAETFARAAQDFTGRDLVVSTGRVIRPPERLLARLHSTIRAAVRIGETSPTLISSPQSARQLEQNLLRLMIVCMVHEGTHEQIILPARQTSIVQNFVNAVESNLGQSLYSGQLCSMTGVSERTLRRVCQEHLGLSPLRFLALRRLHAIRRALLEADRHSATVTAVATGFGVWELGRFAVAYKALFGESPSATLRRQPDPSKIASR